MSPPVTLSIIAVKLLHYFVTNNSLINFGDKMFIVDDLASVLPHASCLYTINKKLYFVNYCLYCAIVRQILRKLTAVLLVCESEKVG
jgi:hypothetical protein